MQALISILRGINVSGQKKILMADLKGLYESLGFTKVTTYIQSGNVVFKAKEKLSSKALQREIEKAIQEKYKFAVPVIVRTVDELEHAIFRNPFTKDKNTDPDKLYVTFLAENPATTELENITNIDYSPDKFIIIDKEVFLEIPGSYGETKLSNKFFESKLKVSATTRNWKTVNKLFEIATPLR